MVGPLPAVGCVRGLLVCEEFGAVAGCDGTDRAGSGVAEEAVGVVPPSARNPGSAPTVAKTAATSIGRRIDRNVPAGVSPRGFSGPGAPAVAARLEHGGPSVAQQYGRPEVFHTPAPSYRAGAPQYGRPMVARTPQMVGRGMPAMTGRVAPQVAARPALGGGGAPHKK
jgi:hypothetical protein